MCFVAIMGHPVLCSIYNFIQDFNFNSNRYYNESIRWQAIGKWYGVSDELQNLVLEKALNVMSTLVARVCNRTLVFATSIIVRENDDET